jgi:hypothetical protein
MVCKKNLEEHTFKRRDIVEVAGYLGKGEIIGFPEDVGIHKQVTVWFPKGMAGSRIVTTALSLLSLAEEEKEEPKPRPELKRVPV